MHGYGHNIICPGEPGKAECKNCTSRKLHITGHHKEKWMVDENSGESIQRFYVSRPCMDGSLLEQTITLSPVNKSGGGHDGNMKMDVSTKPIQLGLGLSNEE